MLAYTYLQHNKFALLEKEKPVLLEEQDAIVKVTLASICTSDLHIKYGSVPRAVPGITIGHEMVGVVEQVGPAVTSVKPGDRVAVNVETFCGTCFFCRHGYVNNCTDPNGGWALGCRIDGGLAEYVRIPYANQGLTKIPDSVSDRQALFTGDILATGFWAARISEISLDDTVLIIGAGPTGICTLLCVQQKHPRQVILCEKDPERLRFVQKHYPDVLTVLPEHAYEFTRQNSALPQTLSEWNSWGCLHWERPQNNPETSAGASPHSTPAHPSRSGTAAAPHTASAPPAHTAAPS